MPDLVIAMLVLAVMATVMGAIIWYLNQIRKDRPDPVINPAWLSIMRPSPHRLPEAGLPTSYQSASQHRRWHRPVLGAP
jgi:hypothetical protein